MGKARAGSDEVRPYVRTQSPERSFETVLRLYREFGRRTFCWVDPTFNVSPRWSDGWAELMLGSELTDARGQPRTMHIAWMRADCVIRDEQAGILKKLVRAGLRQVMIGVERDDDDGLMLLNKHNNGAEICREAFAIFRERYPEVFTIGTVIFGLPGDTMDDLKRLAECQYDLQMDFCFPTPLTPNPGTAVAEDAKRSGRLERFDLANYNYHAAVCTTDNLDLDKLESLYWRYAASMSVRRLTGMARNCLLEPDPRKRQLHRSMLMHGAAIAARSLRDRLTNPDSAGPAMYSRKPIWYDS
jgi:radical SAM superfamily enzyme YgiQ (UPF0313 family)